MFVYLDTSKMQWIIYRPDLHNLQTRIKRMKRVASSCKGNFCQCKNQKYLQIWLLFQVSYYTWKIRNWNTKKKLKIVKGYLCYKTITSQNMSFEAQVIS